MAGRKALLGAFAAASLAAGGQAQEPGSDTAAFLAQLTKSYVETEIAAGAQSEAAYAAVRKYIREAPFLAAREARMRERFGSRCSSLGLDATLDSLVEELASGAAVDRRQLFRYVTRVEAECPQRARDDEALLGDVWGTLERAKSLRRQHYDAFVAQRGSTPASPQESRAPPAEAAARATALPDTRSAPQASGLAMLVGSFRCGADDQSRVLHFGSAGEVVEMTSKGGTALGFAGLYRAVGDRVVIRFIADNTWKIFAVSYEQSVRDEVAWKRSAIASQKVLEFRVLPLGDDSFRIASARSKVLKSGEMAELQRPDCRRLEPQSSTAKALAAHARLAMRYVDRDHDVVPAGVDTAAISLATEIESKKRKEREWFERAPGLVKMMVTDRLLVELRKSTDDKCVPARAALERKASVAMASINRITDSELAKKNPALAETMAGKQLVPAFEEFLDHAGRTSCLMEEASAVGL